MERAGNEMMKKMKKAAAVFLAAFLAAGLLSGCGRKDASEVGKTGAEEIVKIKNIFEKANTNQELHNELTTIFGGGQKQIEVYNLIKALFKESKKNS